MHLGDQLVGLYPGELKMPSRLNELSFVGLVIGERYADMKTAPGTGASRVPVPDECLDEIEQIRAMCRDVFERHQDPEFTIEHDGAMYRVTIMTALDMTDVLFLRAIRAQIRPIEAIPLSEAQRSVLLGRDTRGLIIVSGDMAAGKSSTAASILVARLRGFGSDAVAIEDPPEAVLHGLHGEGRCFQIPASRRHGSYREQLRRALRTGVSALLIGEIRDEDTAVEAIRQSNAGLFVVTTMHSKTPIEAVKRLVDLASHGDSGKAAAMLATGLTSVIHQSLHRVQLPNGTPTGGVRVRLSSLLVSGSLEAGIRSKIREMKFDMLTQDIDAQNKDQVWNQ